DEDEVGDRLDADQADGGAVEVLVGAEDDVPGCHPGSKGGALLLGEQGEVVLQPRGEGVQGAVGGAAEVGEFGQPEEGANRAEARGALLVEDQEQGQDCAAEESLPGGAAEEADEVQVEVLGEVLAQPVAKGGAGDAVLSSVLPLRGRRVGRGGESGKG